MLVRDILPLIAQCDAVCINGSWEGLPRLHAGWASDTRPELLNFTVSKISAGELCGRYAVFITVDDPKNV